MIEGELKKAIQNNRPKPIIFADTREFRSDVISELNGFDCIVKQKMLRVSDYLCSDRLGIERKTANDFLSSIADKRIFPQIKALKDNFEKPILLIEGNDLYNRLHPNVVRGVIAALVVDFSMPIIWTRDAQESAGMIYWLAKREQFEENRPVSVRGEKKNNSDAEKQEYLISGLPGVNVVRAQALLRHFKFPHKVFSSSEKELLEAPGIGKKTAKSIRELLETVYG